PGVAASTAPVRLATRSRLKLGRVPAQWYRWRKPTPSSRCTKTVRGRLPVRWSRPCASTSSDGAIMTELCVGILVGGAATRMGGGARALLRTADGRTVLERVLHEVARAAPGASVVLLGNRQEYAALGLPQLADDPSGVGPLGGLRT